MEGRSTFISHASLGFSGLEYCFGGTLVRLLAPQLRIAEGSERCTPSEHGTARTSCITIQRNPTLFEQRVGSLTRGALGFSVLRFWLFSVFVPKDFGFGVHCGLRIFRFLVSGFGFS